MGEFFLGAVSSQFHDTVRSPTSMAIATSTSSSSNQSSYSSMKSLPPFLVIEIRHAFQSCSRHYAASRRTHFSTLPPQKRGSEQAKQDKNLPIQVIHSQLQAQKKKADDARLQTPPQTTGPDSKGLVPRHEEKRSLDSGRKIPVPLKVIPKADIAPGLTLTPKERLHIEQLTRKLPPRPEPKGICCRYQASV